ncbi:hypothetical protein O181_009312 [Austropuccinia psidii MF-1]|uniref:Uncharacterized protein n=1 Tax=Austropuccinia psidii MF-1 TaxID=1389203 RepID=A0A9Q3BQK5_9BASI|nr:hypothetical protein [Austropuccinia psidii MF-1]
MEDPPNTFSNLNTAQYRQNPNTGFTKYRPVLNTGANTSIDSNTCIGYTNTGLNLKYIFLHHIFMGSQHSNSKLAFFHINQPPFTYLGAFPQLIKMFDLFINIILFLTQRSPRHQVVLTTTARAPLDCTPSVHQNLDSGPTMEGEEPSRRGEPKSRSGEAEDEEGEESVEEYESEETKVAAAIAGVPGACEAPNLATSNQPFVSQSEPNSLKMMDQMTQFMGQLTQAVFPRDTSRAPAFKAPSMKAPNSFDGIKAYKLRGLIKYCKLIFHNDPENFFSDRKKVLYSTSFLTCRAGR